MMATFDVVQRAAASGNNLIITHEPTFYGHLDQTGELAREHDAVLAAKQAFIAQHHLVIWRFHDHWHERKPDGIQAGMIRALGWEKFQNPSDAHLFVIPETTVEKLASDLKARLGIRTLRVVGNPALRVTKLALNPGYPGFPDERHTLQRDDVEVLVMGEGLEWETIEYGADAVAEGRHKALVILGHILLRASRAWKTVLLGCGRSSAKCPLSSSLPPSRSGQPNKRPVYFLVAMALISSGRS